MTGWFIFAAYVAAAPVYARACLRRWTRDKKSTIEMDDSIDRSFVAAAAIGVGLFWPVAMLFYAVKDWLWKPVDRDVERIDRLRSDRDAWRLRTNSSDPEEQRMAGDIVSTLNDILRREP